MIHTSVFGTIQNSGEYSIIFSGFKELVMTRCWLLFILILSNLRPNESGKILPLCTEENENVHQLCTINEEYYPVWPSKPWPKSVTPILDLRGVLDADVDKRTITVLMKIILIWKDQEIFIKNSRSTQWAKKRKKNVL